MPPLLINCEWKTKGSLLFRFMNTAEDDFHNVPAAGAGDVEGDGLAHYPFHDGSDHRIKVI